MNENENLNNNTTDDVCDSIPEGAKDVNLNEEKFSFSSLPDPSTGTASSWHFLCIMLLH